MAALCMVYYWYQVLVAASGMSLVLLTEEMSCTL